MRLAVIIVPDTGVWFEACASAGLVVGLSIAPTSWSSELSQSATIIGGTVVPGVGGVGSSFIHEHEIQPAALPNSTEVEKLAHKEAVVTELKNKIRDLEKLKFVQDYQLRAMRAEKSVGSAIASSSALVWSDCVPPSTAAIASIVVRTMLL